MLSNRPAAIDVDCDDNRALFTDRLGATKAKAARVENMQMKDSAVSILMAASDSL